MAIPSIITIVSNIKRNNELLKYRIDELSNMAERHERHESYITKITELEQSLKEIDLRLERLSKKIE